MLISCCPLSMEASRNLHDRGEGHQLLCGFRSCSYPYFTFLLVRLTPNYVYSLRRRSHQVVLYDNEISHVITGAADIVTALEFFNYWASLTDGGQLHRSTTAGWSYCHSLIHSVLYKVSFGEYRRMKSFNSRSSTFMSEVRNILPLMCFLPSGSPPMSEKKQHLVTSLPEWLEWHSRHGRWVASNNLGPTPPADDTPRTDFSIRVLTAFAKLTAVSWDL